MRSDKKMFQPLLNILDSNITPLNMVRQEMQTEPLRITSKSYKNLLILKLLNAGLLNPSHSAIYIEH